MLIWFDEGEVLPAVEVTGMHEHAMKLILPAFGPVGGFVEEITKVNFEGELEAIIDLRVTFERTNNPSMDS